MKVFFITVFAINAAISGCDKASTKSDEKSKDSETDGENDASQPDGGETESDGTGGGSEVGEQQSTGDYCLVQSELFKSEDGGCKEIKTGAVFSSVLLDGGLPHAVTWEVAAKYCKDLEENGYKDWILPTSANLTSLEGKERGTIHLKIDTAKMYWSSSQIEYRYANKTRINDGLTHNDSFDDKNLAFCTRNTTESAAQDLAKPIGKCLNNDDRFATTDSGCKESKSGLTFSTFAKEGGVIAKLTHAEAVASCDALADDKITSWRLPSNTELISLEGKDRGKLHLDVPAGDYWTSTPDGVSRAHRVRISDGLDNTSSLDSKYPVLCVHD